MSPANPSGITFGDMDTPTLVKKTAEAQNVQTPMPIYKCHKEVWALKIATVVDPTLPGNETDGSRIIIPSDAGYAPFTVDYHYVAKHKPEAGGYYVVYEDGYKSFSPAKAFEDGYARISKANLLDKLQRLESELPQKPGVKVLIVGHRYELANFENKEAKGQEIQFIQKEPVSTGLGELKTVNDGTTNEEVLEMLIDRCGHLHKKFPSRETALAITKMEEALLWLEKRTNDRKKRGVEGKALA